MLKPHFNVPFKEIVMIFWKDAYVTTDDNPHLTHENCLTISIGVIVEEKEDEITISSFYDGIGQALASPYQCIPKGMIKNIRTISCEKLPRKSSKTLKSKQPTQRTK